MSFCVCSGAVLQCQFGSTPAAFNVLPLSKVVIGSCPVGVLSDMTPLVNIPPFGMCSSVSNPAVISATAAAMGTPTAAPCIPAPTGSWEDVPDDVLAGGRAVVTNGSSLTCAWGGKISVKFAGQTGIQL